MKKLLMLFSLFYGLSSYAQSTVVSATVTDTSGTVWINGVVTVTFFPAPNIPGPYNWSGGPYNPSPAPVQIDGSGHFSITLPSNTSIVPTGSQWQFQVCPDASLNCAVFTIPVSASTMDISSIITQNITLQKITATYVPKAYNTNEIQQGPVNAGALMYDSTAQVFKGFNGTSWFSLVNGMGSVGAGTGGQVAYYPSNGSNVIGHTLISSDISDLNTTITNGINTLAVVKSPTTDQNVNQPLVSGKQSNTNITAFNNEYNANLFSGSDICAKTNSAVAIAVASITQPGIPGQANIATKVKIPAGNYSCTTPIKLPHGVWVEGAGDSTYINWAGTGAAIIASDINSPGNVVNGILSNIRFQGVGGSSQIGLYLGGDPTCTGGCTTNPSTNVGFNYIFNNINIIDIGGNGIQYGNGAFNIEFHNVKSNGNAGYGLYVPSTASGGGQYNTFINPQFAQNSLGGWFIDQSPFVTFTMVGADIQYNGIGTSYAHQEITGGNVICTACHLEHYQGPMIVLNDPSQVNLADDIQLIGGQIISVNNTGTDPYLVLVNGAGYFGANGTYFVDSHAVSEFVHVVSPSIASISVFNTNLYSVGVVFGGVTSATGQGIRYEQPVDPATNVPNVQGPRYFGGVSKFDNLVTQTSQILSLDGSGHALACLDAAGNLFRGTSTTCP